MNGGSLKAEVGELQHFILFFSTLPYLFWWTDSVLSLLSDGEEPSQGPKTCSAVSYSSLVPFLFPLLRHPGMKAPANTLTHKHTQKNQWLCILHELSTSEGLFAFFHFATYSRDDEVEARTCT